VADAIQRSRPGYQIRIGRVASFLFLDPRAWARRNSASLAAQMFDSDDAMVRNSNAANTWRSTPVF